MIFLEGHCYKTIRPALYKGNECGTKKYKQNENQTSAEMCKLRWTCAMTRNDRIRNEYVRGNVWFQ